MCGGKGFVAENDVSVRIQGIWVVPSDLTQKLPEDSIQVLPKEKLLGEQLKGT